MRWGLVALLVLGCDDGSEGSRGPADLGLVLDGTAGDFDGSTVDLGVDAAPDAGPACGEGVEGTFELAPGVGETQIHADGVLAGGGVWITFNREEEDGANFDVWAMQLGCDGRAIVAPFRVNETLGFNDVDPVIAASGDRLLIAWSRDNQGEQPNLELVYRVLDLDGGFAGPELSIITSRGGAPLISNHWLPAVVGFDEGFALAGSRGLDGVGFQTFVQLLRADGSPVGDAVAQDGEFGQVEPEIAADGVDRLYVAWTEQADPERVVHTTWTVTGAGFEPAPEVAFPGPSAAVNLSTGNGRWIAATVDQGAGLKAAVRAGEFDSDSGRMLFGEAGQNDHSPTVVADADGGWVAWYRIIRGIRNEVWWARFSAGPGEPEAGAAAQVETAAPAAPYAIMLVDVGHRALLVWSEGESPRFRLMGRFLSRE